MGQPVGYLQSLVELSKGHPEKKSLREVNKTGFEPRAAACKPIALTTGPRCLTFINLSLSLLNLLLAQIHDNARTSLKFKEGLRLN